MLRQCLMTFAALLLLLCTSADEPKRQTRDTTNEYVDKVLVNAQALIREHKYDPYHLANFELNFPVQIVFKMNGKLEAWNVQLHGLSSIHRSGEATTTDHGHAMEMSVGLGINNLVFDGRTKFSAGIFKFTFELALTANYVSARANIFFPLDGSKPRVSQFNVEHIGEIKANNRNWGIFNWLANLILNFALNKMKDTIKTQIREPVITTLNEILDKIPM